MTSVDLGMTSTGLDMHSSSIGKGMLTVCPISGTDLADDSRFGQLDLYIKLSVRGEDGRSFEAVSSVLKDVSNGQVNWKKQQPLHIPVNPTMLNEPIHITVWGQDRFDDDLLSSGSCESFSKHKLTERCRSSLFAV